MILARTQRGHMDLIISNITSIFSCITLLLLGTSECAYRAQYFYRNAADFLMLPCYHLEHHSGESVFIRYNYTNVTCGSAKWTVTFYGERQSTPWDWKGSPTQANIVVAESNFTYGNETHLVKQPDEILNISAPTYIHSNDSCIHTIKVTLKEEELPPDSTRYSYQLLCRLNMTVDGETRSVEASHDVYSKESKEVNLIFSRKSSDIIIDNIIDNSTLNGAPYAVYVDLGESVKFNCSFMPGVKQTYHQVTLLRGSPINMDKNCPNSKSCVKEHNITVEDHKVTWQCRMRYECKKHLRYRTVVSIKRSSQGCHYVTFSDTLVTMVILSAKEIIMNSSIANDTAVMIGSYVQMECQAVDIRPANHIYWGLRYQRNTTLMSSNNGDIQLADLCKNSTDSCSIIEDISGDDDSGFTITSRLQVKVLEEVEEIGYVCWIIHSNGSKLENITWLFPNSSREMSTLIESLLEKEFTTKDVDNETLSNDVTSMLPHTPSETTKRNELEEVLTTRRNTDRDKLENSTSMVPIIISEIKKPNESNLGDHLVLKVECRRDSTSKKVVTNGIVYKVADSSNFVFNCKTYQSQQNISENIEINIIWFFKPSGDNTAWMMIDRGAELRIIDMKKENIGTYMCRVHSKQTQFNVTGLVEEGLIMDYHVDIACSVVAEGKKKKPSEFSKEEKISSNGECLVGLVINILLAVLFYLNSV